jgi:hypothetical protein
MATWYEIKRKQREQTERLRRRGLLNDIPEEKPLFCGSGRGRAFGRRPYTSDSPPRPPIAADDQAGPETQD